MDPINGQTPPGRQEREIPDAWKENPFQAPSTPVDDVHDANAELGLASSPRSVSFGRGAGWIGDGWSLFRESMGLWIGMVIVFGVIQIAVSLVPVLGSLASIFLSLTISAGLMIGAQSLDNGEGLRFDHLFAGFQRNFGQLLLVGLIYLVGTIVMVILVVVVFGGAMFALFMGKQAGALAGMAPATIVLAMLLFFALILPLVMSIWFAPALVALNDVPAVQAMKLSFIGCLKNFLPFLLYGIVLFLLGILAIIPIGLGLLLLVPTMICAQYISYKEIFLE